MDKLNINSEEILNAELGLNLKKKYFNSATGQDTDNVYHLIQILNDTEFNNLAEYLDPDTQTATDLVANELSGVTLVAGSLLVGYYTNIEVKTGLIKAHSFNTIE